MENINFEYTKQHLNAKVFKAYFAYISKYYPSINLSALCLRAGLPISYFDNPNAWVSIDFDFNFIREIKILIKDPEFEYKVGQSSFNKDSLGPVYFLVKNILTLEEIYNNIWRFPKYLNKVVTFVPVEKRSGFIKIRISAVADSLNEKEKEALRVCLPEMIKNSLGYYSGFAKAKGLAEAKISAVRISEDEYDLEIKYPLERSKFIFGAVYPALTATVVGLSAGYWTNNIYESIGLAALSGLFVSWIALRKRSVDLSEAANQAEETLNKLDVQYRVLVDTKISLQRRLVEAQAINELTNALIQTTSEDEILQNASDKLTKILNFDRILIMLHDSEKKYLEVRTTSISDEKFSEAFRQFKLPIEISSDDPSKISNIYRFGNPVLIANVKEHLKSLNEESRQLLEVSKSKSFICVPIKSNSSSHGVILADTFYSDRVLTQEDLDVLALAGRQIAIALEKQKAQADVVDAFMEMDTLAKSYSRFVPFETIKLLGFKSVTDVRMEAGRELNMTIVFCDIRGFTSMAEKMSPADSMAFLNSYFSYLAPVFQRNNGIIDKFMGDGIMALFVDPVDAFKAAGEFQLSLAEYNKIHRSGGSRDMIRTGMGIHFGKVLMGAVGYQDRLSISVVSDAVNLTSRLDGLTKKFGVDILSSEDAYHEANDKDNFRLIAQLKVEGRAGMTRIYEYFGHLTKESRDIKLQHKHIISRLVENTDRKFDFSNYDVTKVNEDSVLAYYFNENKKQAA